MQIHIDTLNLHIHTGHTALGAELVKAALQPSQDRDSHDCQADEKDSDHLDVQITGTGKLPPELADLLDKIFAIANEKPEKGE